MMAIEAKRAGAPPVQIYPVFIGVFALPVSITKRLSGKVANHWGFTCFLVDMSWVMRR